MKKIDGRSKQARAEKANRRFYCDGTEAVTKDAAPMCIPTPEGVLQGHLNRYKVMDTAAPQKTILQEAHDLIYGDREAEYGHPRKNLGNIADQWSLYMHQKYDTEFGLVAEDVCWMMSLLKMCREYGGEKRDSLSDAAGYIGLIERVRES